MTKKGQRDQALQPGKAEKAYGGYLPSMEGQGRSDVEDSPSLRDNPQARTEKYLFTEGKKGE
ncbi:MAG TPA: hypothetical protein VK464_26630 [Symbiobacteriaceae bacterium]|nr:hypothetical protein [Symbiobacteriaceae bacterium]